MICKNCGKKMEYTERGYAPDTFDCECGEWIEVSIAFNELKFRAEKAESELKAIKARIKLIQTLNEINGIDSPKCKACVNIIIK
ncbi:MAG: hypothetical protein WC262_13145, partial [Bacteroidales bacterium]